MIHLKKKNCCLFEYPEYKVYSFVAMHIMFKAYHLFKVGISQLSYPSTKIAYLPGCTRIFYSDISIRVKKQSHFYYSSKRRDNTREMVESTEWVSLTGNTLCISQCLAQLGCVWVHTILGLQ